MSSRGLRLGRHRATTRHLAAVYPFHVDAGIGSRGVYLGTNETAGGAAWCYDPFQLYTDGLLSSPNMVVFGNVGSGKSSFVKTYLYRSIGLLRSPGGGPRWCAVLDPKGEYKQLADALGLRHLRLQPGGQTRLNPLDAGAIGGTTAEELAARRATVTIALTEALLHRQLTPIEDAAVGWACAAVSRPAAPPPTLADVVALVANPTGEMADQAQQSAAVLAHAVEAVRFGLGKLLDRELRGMFDGPSTEQLDFGGRGVVIDLSAVYQDPEALTVVMIAATGWLQSLLAAPESEQVPRRVQVLEELWALLANERVARYYQACQKLARRYGVANIAVTHRIADLRAQTDDGTAAAKIASGLLADTQTRVLFRQQSDQVAEARELLGLSAVEASSLPTLVTGQALWRVADHAALVQHHRSPIEETFANTDGQMRI